MGRVVSLRFPFKVLVELELSTFPPLTVEHVVEVNSLEELYILLEKHSLGYFDVVGVLIEEVEE